MTLNYPPLIYWYYGIWHLVLVNVFQLSWFSDYLIETASVFGHWWFSAHLILIKLPYLPLDILGGWLFANLFTTRKQKILAWVGWLFNPLNLFATYMMGQFDILAVVAMVGSLWLVQRQRWYWAAWVLGIGVALKLFPIFLIVPLALMKQSWKDRMILGVMAILPYAITILPYLGSTGYRTTALVAEQSLKSLYASIALSGGEKLLLYPWLLATAYLWWFYAKPNVERLWSRWLVVLLLFLSLTHYHPQWLLWVSPLIIMDLIRTGGRYGWLVTIGGVCWLGQLLLFDQSLSLGLFAPIMPNVYNGWDIWQLFGITVDQTLWRSLWQSGFVAVATIMIWRHLPKWRGAESDEDS